MFGWDEYLRLARELADRIEDEAALRSAISRAYYAAYGRAADLLLDRGELNPRAISHRAVWLAFRVPEDRDRWEIWTNSVVLKERRERADYRKDFAASLPHAAGDSVARAGSILSLLDRL